MINESTTTDPVDIRGLPRGTYNWNVWVRDASGHRSNTAQTSFEVF